ncbi:MAG TPA: hypothetical protein VGE59_02690 [Patescibacteria group bacterium]
MTIVATLLSFLGLYGLAAAFDPSCSLDGCGGMAIYALSIGCILLLTSIILFVHERKKIAETGYFDWKEQSVQFIKGLIVMGVISTIAWQVTMYFFR